jgi:shikimate dehydrogenase
MPSRLPGRQLTKLTSSYILPQIALQHLSGAAREKQGRRRISGQGPWETALQIASSQSGQPLRIRVLQNLLPGPGAITIGLLGRGIGASLSPLMHEREGARQGLDYRYHLIDFDRLELDDAGLSAMLAEARELGFAGLNVTYPFKQAILPLLDGLAPDAAAIGAVNTVVFEGERAVGHNTDCWGFAESFRQELPNATRRRVLQLGSGGAGAAVSQALLQCGVERLDLFDTDEQRAETTARRLRSELGADVHAVADLIEAAGLADGIVNATPVGMTKHPGLPLAGALVQARQWVADVVYFPLETELIRHARALGCATMPGGGMAVYQAVRAFTLFSGRQPDVAAMTATFRAAVR